MKRLLILFSLLFTFAICESQIINVGPPMRVIAEAGEEPASTLLNGILAYWTLDEASGTIYDETDNNVDGTFGGDYSHTGIIGDCLGFVRASNDYVDLGDPAVLKVSTFTYAAWVKPIQDYETRSVICWYSAGPQFRVSGDDHVQLLKRATSEVGASTGTITNAIWNHIAVTYNATSGAWIFYINGSASGSGTTADPTFEFTNVYLGMHPDASESYDGDMDEVGIWNRVLTSDEMTELYNSGTGVTYPF